MFITGFQVFASGDHLLEIKQHLHLGMSPRLVDELLRDPSLRHLPFYVIQGGFVLADIVRHIPVGIYGQEIRTSGY